MKTVTLEREDMFGGPDYFRMLGAFLVIAIHTSPLASFNIKADYLITHVICRVAVPFFLMTTGYFLLPQYLFDRSRNIAPLLGFLKKIAFLYLGSAALYFPLNLYAGHFRGMTIWGFLRIVFFDGTFYHLWYFPAVILGTLLVFGIGRRLPFPAAAAVVLILYVIGLSGDSYYGFFADGPLGQVYLTMFRLFSYTRNGIFFAPIFLLLGAGIEEYVKSVKPVVCIAGFAVSLAAMTAEGIALHWLDVQRHDSMYLALLPCAWFLFQILLLPSLRPVKSLRRITTGIYIIHPLFIVLVRYAAKILQLENILIGNSAIHYVAVCLLSCACAVIMEKLSGRGKRRRLPYPQSRAWIELDRENLCKNVSALESLLPEGCRLMPAVKADAYGHGALPIAKELNRLGVNAFCVATVSEGRRLREGGVRGEILVLGYTHPKDFPQLRKYGLTQTVIDHNYAKTLNDFGRKIQVQIKIDTGMHRLGESPENMEGIRGIFQMEHLSVKGMYTHLCADETVSEREAGFTRGQGESFYRVVARLKEHGYSCGRIHLLASYGLINYPWLAGDYARVGISLYGVLSRREHLEDCPVPLCPVLSLRVRVAQVKDLRRGETAGYGLSYIAEEDRKIAILTAGYADGIPRALSHGRGAVLIKGGKAPIVGSICMDQMLVDVTGIPGVRSGDVATVIGRDGTEEITAYDLAEQSGTITNEILGRLGGRVERVMTG